MSGIDRGDIVRKVTEILDANANDPIKQLRICGQALIEIADALEPLSPEEAVRVMRSVMVLEGVEP